MVAKSVFSSSVQIELKPCKDELHNLTDDNLEE